MSSDILYDARHEDECCSAKIDMMRRGNSEEMLFPRVTLFDRLLRSPVALDCG
jgi:hypothetical protein